jgi:hypothetical protein
LLCFAAEIACEALIYFLLQQKIRARQKAQQAQDSAAFFSFGSAHETDFAREHGDPPKAEFAKRRSIGPQFIRDNNRRDKALAAKELAQRIAAALSRRG